MPASTIDGIRFKARLARVVFEPDVLAAIIDDLEEIGGPINILA